MAAGINPTEDPRKHPSASRRGAGEGCAAPPERHIVGERSSEAGADMSQYQITGPSPRRFAHGPQTMSETDSLISSAVTACRRFSPRAISVRSARSFTRGVLARQGIEAADVEIVVGELAANAYKHAQTPFTVALRCAAGGCGVEVFDESRALPADEARVAVTDAGGRGLMTVDALASAWGARPVYGGKVVWAEVRAVA